MEKFIRPADRWILVVSLVGVILLGRGWHNENIWMQLAGFLILILTTRLMKEHYTGWRAILHFDLYLVLAGLLFLFS